MTKRFVAYFDKDYHYIIQDLVNEDEYQVGFVNCDEDLFLELVNALAETSCDCITDCEIVMKKLKEENEQLKQQNDYLKSLKWNQDCINEISIGIQQRESLERQNNELVKENEQLKKEIKDYHNAFDCSQCKYQNYDWFDDGDEFEVCNKGNNEAQMDNHSCKDWEEL